MVPSIVGCLGETEAKDPRHSRLVVSWPWNADWHIASSCARPAVSARAASFATCTSRRTTTRPETRRQRPHGRARPCSRLVGRRATTTPSSHLTVTSIIQACRVAGHGSFDANSLVERGACNIHVRATFEPVEWEISAHGVSKKTGLSTSASLVRIVCVVEVGHLIEEHIQLSRAQQRCGRYCPPWKAVDP